MEYTQLTADQLQEMRRNQLLQYEGDFAQAQIRIAVADAVLATADASAEAKAQAQLQRDSDSEVQRQLDIAHAEVLAAYSAADQTAPGSATV